MMESVGTGVSRYLHHTVVQAVNMGVKRCREKWQIKAVEYEKALSVVAMKLAST
jgi:hypothetical protein